MASVLIFGERMKIMAKNPRLIGKCRDREQIYDEAWRKLIVAVVNPDDVTDLQTVKRMRDIIFKTQAKLEKLAIDAVRESTRM